MQNTTAQVSATASALVIRRDDKGNKKSKRTNLFASFLRPKKSGHVPQIKADTLVEHALRISIEDYRNEIYKSVSIQTPANIAALSPASSTGTSAIQASGGAEFEGTKLAGLPSLPQGYTLAVKKTEPKKAVTPKVTPQVITSPKHQNIVEAFPAHLRPAVSALASTLAMLPESELAIVSQKGDWKSRKLIRMISDSPY